MGWHRSDEDYRADHYRDHAKQEPRPGDRGFTDSDVLGKYNGPADPLPLHIQSPPLSTSMDLVICVRGMKNLQDAAALIDRFIEAKATEQRLDAVAAGARP